MKIFVMAAILAGILLGHWVIPDSITGYLDNITTAALCLMLLGVGIDIGSRRETWGKLWRMGYKVLLVPALVAVGSLGGVLAGGLFLECP